MFPLIPLRQAQGRPFDELGDGFNRPRPSFDKLRAGFDKLRTSGVF